MKKIIYVSTLISLLFILTACQSTISPGSDPGSQPAVLPITSTPKILPLGDNATPVITMTPVPNSSSNKASLNTGSHQEKIVIVNPDHDITIADPGGQSAHRYTVDPGVTAAALSPDGKKVAYNCDKTLTHVIYLLDVQTGQSTQISKDQIGGGIDTLLWSPQGDQLAFSGTLGDSSIIQIYLLDPSSGEVKPLTHFTKGVRDNTFVAIGSWSADGNTVSFSTGVMPSGGGVSRNTLQTLNVKTGEIKVVLDEDYSGDITRLGGSWVTPDGKIIFFDGKKNGHYRIFRIDVDGSHLDQVTSDEIPYDVSGPVEFSPDGQSFFAYAADQKAGDPNGVPSLFSIDGHLIRQLSDYPGKVGSWNQILDTSTTSGVSLSVSTTPFLTQITDTPTATSDAYVIFNDNVNVRSGPNALSTLLGVANMGEKTQALGQTPGGGWIKIVYPAAPEGDGWVNAALVSLHSSGQLPIAPEAQPLTVEPTVQADLQELAAIQKFNPNEAIGNYRLEKSTWDLNLPNLKVDVFHINTALYVVDPSTNRVVEYEAGRITAPSGSSIQYTSDQLKQMAIQLVKTQVPGINLDIYTFKIGQKTDQIVDIFFFMWFIGQPDQPGSVRVMYVGYQSDGTLIGYINAMP